MTVAYVLALVAFAYFTRATARRIVGALVGAAAASLVALGMIALCEALGWWQLPFVSTAYLWLPLYVGLAISLTPIYLITWRLTRRFGRRALTWSLVVVAVIGPPRDYLIGAKYPDWMVFAPGVAPFLADLVTYVAVVALGHAVMSMIAGPGRADRFAR